MKKLLGSVLALAFVVVASQANAELLKNFKFGGSVEVAAIAARNIVNFNTRANNNTTPADHMGFAQTRIMLNMDWDLLDDVHSKVTLRKNNRIYGAAGDNNGSESLDRVQNQVFIDQGYFKIDKLFGFLDASFGRMFYGEPGDLIVYYGPKYNQYGLQVTGIDGARFDWAGEKAYATAVAFEPNTNGWANAPAGLAPGTFAGIKDIRGFIAGNKGDEKIDGKVYLWNQVTHDAGANTGGAQGNMNKNDNLYVFGGKVKAKLGGLYGSLEAAMNFGENRFNPGGATVQGGAGGQVVSVPYRGRAIIADLGLKADVEQIGTFNPWGQFAWGSGNGEGATLATLAGQNINHNMDFTAIATDYRPGALYGRFDMSNPAGAGATLGNGVLGTGLASNGLANRIIIGLGAKVTPSAINKLTAGLAYYNIRLENIGNGATATSVGTGGHRSIGQEYDVTADWKHSENVSLKGTIGNFQPGDVIRFNAAPGTTNSAWLSALDVSVKF